MSSDEGMKRLLNKYHEVPLLLRERQGFQADIRYLRQAQEKCPVLCRPVLLHRPGMLWDLPCRRHPRDLCRYLRHGVALSKPLRPFRL